MPTSRTRSGAPASRGTRGGSTRSTAGRPTRPATRGAASGAGSAGGGTWPRATSTWAGSAGTSPSGSGKRPRSSSLSGQASAASRATSGGTACPSAPRHSFRSETTSTTPAPAMHAHANSATARPTVACAISMVAWQDGPVLDHLSIQCADVAASAAFYDAVLAPLGGRRVLDFGDVIGYGVPPTPNFWIGPRATGGGFREAHIAFTAPDRAAGPEFFPVAVESGAAV